MSNFDWTLWTKNFPIAAERVPSDPRIKRPETVNVGRGNGARVTLTFEELQQHILPLFRDELHEKIREAYAFMPNDEGSEVADHVLAALCSTPAPTDEDYARDWYAKTLPHATPWDALDADLRAYFIDAARRERDRNHDDWENTHAYS